jgi:Transglycosylase SLT domain
MNIQEITDRIAAAAVKNGVPPNILYGLLKHESANFKPEVLAHTQKSSTGAFGIAQFMPATGKAYGLSAGTPDVGREIEAAAKEFGSLYKKYNGDASTALNAYNWGQGNVDKYLAGKIKNKPAETIKHEAASLKIAGLSGTGSSGQQGYEPTYTPKAAAPVPSFINKLKAMAPMAAAPAPEPVAPAVQSMAAADQQMFLDVPLTNRGAPQMFQPDDSWRDRVIQQAQVSEGDRAQKETLFRMLGDGTGTEFANFARLPQGVESALKQIVSEA